MKRFSFSLEKLLDLRLFREKEAELALGRAVSERNAVQIQLDDVARKRVSSSQQRRSGLSVQELLSIEHYITRLDIQKETLLEKLAAAELVVERARKIYVDATRGRQVLTKLKERKTASWHKEVLQEEADTLDDIVNYRDRERL